MNIYNSYLSNYFLIKLCNFHIIWPNIYFSIINNSKSKYLLVLKELGKKIDFFK